MSMVSTLKFYNHISAGSAPCQPERSHHGLRTGADETDRIETGTALKNQFGYFNFFFMASAISQPLGRRGAYRFHDRRMRMSQDKGPPRLTEVYKFISIDIRNSGARCAANIKRMTANTLERAHGTIDAA